MSPGPILERTSQRRVAVRYKLHLPVIFHWNDGKEHTGGGFTSHVALDGALILSRMCPPVGTDISIEVLLPSPDRSGEDLKIQCVGRVTRIVNGTGCVAFEVQGSFDVDHFTDTAESGESRDNHDDVR